MGKAIAIDAMGGDFAPFEIVKGAVEGANAYGVEVCLFGDEPAINNELKKYSYDKSKVTVRHTTQVIAGSDSPTDAIKNKKDSSMVVALNAVKSGECSAIISAGNTGALMAGATIIVGRIKGIERPALGALIPNAKGYTFFIDCGANADVKPHYLTQFALMGSVYLENIMGIKNPKVGLINVGSEKTKGNELYKEVHQLLDKTDLNFIGNVEGTDIAAGKTDVLVMDGFIGNIVLKYSEGLGMALFGIIKKEITKTTKSKIASAVLKNDFKRIKNGFDASEYGGAPLLGLKGLVVKAHGSSNSMSIKNAVKQCKDFTETDIVGKITENIAKNIAKSISSDVSKE